MAHEGVTTIERDGRFYNVQVPYGPTEVGGILGGVLGARVGQAVTPIFPWERAWYPTLKLAVDAARLRSEAIGMIEQALSKILGRKVTVQ